MSRDKGEYHIMPNSRSTSLKKSFPPVPSVCFLRAPKVCNTTVYAYGEFRALIYFRSSLIQLSAKITQYHDNGKTRYSRKNMYLGETKESQRNSFAVVNRMQTGNHNDQRWINSIRLHFSRTEWT